MKKSVVISAVIALLSGITAQAVTIQENAVFPDSNVIISQLVDQATVGVRDIDVGTNDIDANLGQTFKLDTETTVRAITLKSASNKTFPGTTGDISIWIGQNTDTNVSNCISGATNLLTTVSMANLTTVSGNFYTFNLDSDVVLPAGNYSFQLDWATTGDSHQAFWKRANGGGSYTNGGLLYAQTMDGAVVDYPMSSSVTLGGSLVFGLHSTTIGTVASLTVDPSEITMLVPLVDYGTGTVSVVYTADTTVEIDVSIFEETNPGAFTVLSATPQTLVSPTNNVLEFQFDNTVAGLAPGATATGLVTIAWTVTGSGITNDVFVPISAANGFAPDEMNNFTASVSSDWSTSANWDLGRVPGALGADEGIIQGGKTAEVVSDYTGLFPWTTTVRENATLNIAADFLNADILRMGHNAGHIGYVNQTDGAVSLNTVAVGDIGGTSLSNSVYTMTGGTLVFNKAVASRTLLTANPMGLFVLDGGAVSLDLNDAFATLQIQGGGTVKLQSGSVDITNGVPQSVVNLSTPVEISGGSLNVDGQPRFYSEFKVIGDAATIHTSRMGTYAGASFVFELGPSGVSTIDSSGGYQSLTNSLLLVDGANYAGGTTSINLFKSSNLNNQFAAGNITLTNFADGVTAVVTQDKAVNAVILTITVPGYAGWIGGYGLSGTNADWNVDYDGDSENNFYEYAFGGDPTNIAVKGYVPTSASVEDGGTTYFEYVYPRRSGSDTGLDYQPVFGTDLVYTNWSGADVVELPTTGTIDADYESVTNRVDTTGIPTGFMELIIDQL